MTIPKSFFGLLFAALVVVLSFATSESAQAQGYTVCNNRAVPAQVCVFVDCGNGPFALPPCPAVINPGMCFTWPVPAGCLVTGVRVNGAFYPFPGGLPFCYGVPPNQVCFYPGVPSVVLR